MDGQNDRVQHFLGCLLNGVDVVTTVRSYQQLRTCLLAIFSFVKFSNVTNVAHG